MDEPDATVLEFVDNGYSGTHFERPAVQELLELVRTGNVNCIVVKDFSRFGRNMIEAGYFLQMVFPLFRTRFISVSDAYDSIEHEGDTGGLEVAFKLLVHEQYSRDLSIKIKTSRQVRARRGESISKNCAFGYRKGSNGRLEIDEEAARIVKLIFSLASEGKSLAEIAEQLYKEGCPTPTVYGNRKRRIMQDACYNNVWHKSVIRKMLTDEQYIGTYTADKSEGFLVGSSYRKTKPENTWVKIPNYHPAIIGAELFQAVREVIDKRGEPLRKRKLGTSERYAAGRNSPLKGKVFCGSCNHAMTLSITKNAAFHCQFTRAAPDTACHRLKFSEADLSDMILDIIRRQQVLNSSDNGNMKVLRSHPEQEYEHLISKCRNEKQRLYERFVCGEISAEEHNSAKALQDKEIERLNQGCSALKKAAVARKTDKQSRELIDAAFRENTLTHDLVDLLVDRVNIFPDDRITVIWKIPEFNSDKLEDMNYA